LGPAHAAAVATLIDLKFNGSWAGQPQEEMELTSTTIGPQTKCCSWACAELNWRLGDIAAAASVYLVSYALEH
jgi:hypothetical protein